MPRYDAATALIVADVQNDFADPGGALAVNGGEEVAVIAAREARAAAAAGALVVYTQDWHPPSTPHFEKDGGIWPVHCVADTWGAALHPALVPVQGAVFVRKGTGGEDGYSAFGVRDPVTGERRDTDLPALLRERGVRRVVVLGLATDYCVKETVLDARAMGLPTAVVAEGVRAVDLTPGDGERALDAMREAGAVVEVE